MRIFIDETGNCVVPQPGRNNFCCLGALAIPEATYDLFCREFSKLTRRWPKSDGEVKGKGLDSAHIKDLARLANRLSLTYFFVGTDMAFANNEDTICHRGKQADALLEALTPEHDPGFARQLKDLSEKLRKMSPQLYVQFVLLTELVHRLILTMSVYYSITRPRELGSFNWTIDAKGDRVTTAEYLWELLSGPILQSKFLNTPLCAIDGTDQSDFDNNYRNEFQRWPDYMPAPSFKSSGRGDRIVNLKKLLSEKRRFANSKDSIGLQAVDTFTNAIRRTMHGELSPSVVTEIGSLMLAVPDSEAAAVIHLARDMDSRPIEAPYSDHILQLRQAAEAKFAAALDEFCRKVTRSATG